MSSLSFADQTAIRDLVELAVEHRRLRGFSAIDLDMAERVQLRLLDHGFAATWDGRDLVIGRLIE